MSEPVTINGVCRLRAWEPGRIEHLVKYCGLTTEKAKEQAEAEGRVKYDVTNHNLITQAGRRLICALLIGDVTVGLTYFAIGTGTNTPNIWDTKLQTEVKRKAITSRSRNQSEVYLSTFFPAADCGYNIRECGVFGYNATAAANSGLIWSHFLQSYDNAASPLDLTFDYTLEVQ